MCPYVFHITLGISNYCFMKCYLKIRPLRTDDDFNRYSEYISTLLPDKDKVDLSDKFNRAIKKNPYYQSNRHVVRKNAVRSVELYIELQGIKPDTFNLTFFHEQIINWVKKENLGYIEDNALFMSCSIVENIACCRFIYIPVDADGMINYRQTFSFKFLYINTSFKKFIWEYYNCPMTTSSLVLAERVFDSGAKDEQTVSLKLENENLNGTVKEQNKQIESLKDTAKELKSEIYDLKNELAKYKMISDNYNELKKISGDANCSHKTLTNIIKAAVRSKFAYKYFKSMNMEQESQAFVNVDKYSSVYLKKHPEEKENFDWI